MSWTARRRWWGRGRHLKDVCTQPPRFRPPPSPACARAPGDSDPESPRLWCSSRAQRLLGGSRGHSGDAGPTALTYYQPESPGPHGAFHSAPHEAQLPGEATCSHTSSPANTHCASITHRALLRRKTA